MIKKTGMDTPNLIFDLQDKELLKIGLNYSKREMEIMKLIEAGLTNDAIADKLCISLFTINNHRANILAKSDKPHISDVIQELHETGY